MFNGNAVEGGGGSSFINGYNEATFIGLGTQDSKRDASKKWVVAEFTIGSKSTIPQKVFLSNDQMQPQTVPCSMILKAFGDQEVKEGTDGKAIAAALEKHKNKKCALLLMPKWNDKRQQSFHEVPKGASEPLVLPFNQVGKTYDGPVATGETQSTGSQGGQQDNAQTNGGENEIPF